MDPNTTSPVPAPEPQPPVVEPQPAPMAPAPIPQPPVAAPVPPVAAMPGAGLPADVRKDIQSAGMAGMVLINVVLGLALAGLSWRVRQANDVRSAVSSMKLVLVAVVIQLILSVLSGGSPGLLVLLLAFFTMRAFSNLYKAGLTTSKAPLMAKAK